MKLTTTATVKMRFDIAATATTLLAAVASASPAAVHQTRDTDLSQVPVMSLVKALVHKLPVAADVSQLNPQSGNVGVGVSADLSKIPMLGSLPPFDRTITVNVSVGGLSGLLPSSY
jgi:hypothetical protein